ncbi:Extracellular matrix protein fras1 [Halocaridina rubra]|uniref:Extracellular matrix protein fras1 n=1 Tax=Halocaridina rubra TaxID=373956 RepID=A0AAN8XGQ1_HALRR
MMDIFRALIIFAPHLASSFFTDLTQPSLSTSAGVCYSNGYAYPNTSTWQPEVCMHCECQGWVSVCQRETCFHPVCPPTHSLHRHPEVCCPYCKPPTLPCLAGHTIYQDGEIWSPGGCEECRCINGTVSCGRVHCEIPSCRDGQVILQQEGKCCPECISVGRSCKVDKEVYNDGAFWSPMPCTQCHCQDGRTQCFVPECPELDCVGHQINDFQEGMCCPSCEKPTCHKNGKIYKSRELWKEDACTTCTCVDGEVHCHHEECPTYQCQLDERLYQEEGSCCPRCVKKQGWCLLVNGSKMPTGSTWNSSECDICACREGDVSCSMVLCDNAKCKPHEHLVTLPGECCPQCVLNSSICFHDYKIKGHGEVWTTENCQLCSCSSGHVTCYVPDCPPCPIGMAPSYLSSKDCCPECQPVACPYSCLTCESAASLPRCLSCRPGYYLLNESCVSSCEKGWFIQGGVCSPCHHSCAECIQATQYHCSKCSSFLLREGECVDDCGEGYYATDSVCQACHSSCDECSGPAINQCQVCPIGSFLLSGNCIDTCPRGYYSRDRSCEACEENCHDCGVGECLKCSEGFLLQDGHCQIDCSPGTYHGPDNTCLRCHPTCATCSDAGVSSCTSCPHYLLKSGSTCVSTCPRGTYLYKVECHPCHPSCAECSDSGSDSCIVCASSEQIVVMKNLEITGECHVDCPPTHQLFNHICMGPPLGCDIWHVSQPASCQMCLEGWLLQDQQCTRKCGGGFYLHSYNKTCLACDPRCQNCSGPGHTECLSCHKGATLHTRENRSECLTKCYRRRYLAPDNTCQACHKSCEACTHDHTISETVCLQCKNNKRIPEGDHCVHNCHQGFYFNDIMKRCQPCHPSCESCEGPHLNNCTACSEGYNLKSMGFCEADECPSGYYFGTNNSCMKCKGDCNMCSDDGTKCITCPGNKQLLFGKCVSRCPQMFFSDASNGGECQECHWTCKECLGHKETDCSSCAENALQEGNRCVMHCSPEYYPVDKICRQCPPGCLACNTSSACLKCRSPYLLQDGICVTSCRPGTFANVFDNICYDCGINCLSCSLYECHSCRNPYLMQDGQCVDQCSANFYPDIEDGTCLHNTEMPILKILIPLIVEYNSIYIINSSVLHVEDKDTSHKRLSVIFEIMPSNGFIYHIHKGRDILIQEKEIMSIDNFKKGQIYFKHDKNRPLHGNMKISIFDGFFRSSVEDVFINVISKHKPVILINEPLLLYKGKTGAITSRILNIHDLDSPERIQVRVLSGLKHGRLSNGDKKVYSFTLQDVSQSLITYTHDNTNSTSDMILLQSGDGHFVVNFIFHIYIFDEERSKPVLVKNVGTHVLTNHRVQLTPQVLRASDIDSDDENLVYTLLPMLQNPGHGKLTLMIPLPPAPDGFYNDGWTQMDESHLVRPATSFTQRDLNEGLVWYFHSDERNARSDELFFSVSDGSHPPNILGDQSFVIQLEPSEEPTMIPLPEAQLEITVQDGQAAQITQDHLSFMGVKSAEHLVYTITHPLRFGEGSLFHIDSPGLELRQFTQADINDMKIIYMPPLGDMVMEEKEYSFKFTVSDQYTGKSIELPEQKFTIHVVPQAGSHLSFAIENPELMIRSHETVVLDHKFLELIHQEQNDEIEFMLLEAPVHGSITQEIDGEIFVFTEEDSLNQEEAQRSNLKYNHDGSESMHDSIVFLALGRTSEATTRISITVRHEDQQQPVRGNNASFSFELLEYESKVISSLNLHFTDIHSGDDELIYTLTTQPGYGSLVITEPSGNTRFVNETDKFTQADVVYGLLNYSSNVEIGLGDATENLVFNVTDPSNNVLSNQVLRVLIRSVDNEAPDVAVTGVIVVDEGGSVVIPPVFKINDVDTPPDNLLFVMEAPPIFGYITNSYSDLHRGGIATLVFQFSLSDIMAGKVVYVQSQHRHQEPTEDSLLFHVSDGVNLSPTLRINITIRPKNDESPIILGEQVVLEQGQTVIINNQSLFISDVDTSSAELVINIAQSPLHGSVHKKASPDVSIKKSELLSRGQSFTFQDVISELILYSHDGSREPEDVMEIMVSDGDHETGGLVEFRILQKADEMPRLLLNQGLTLKSGEISLISSSLLLAEDMDSETDMIKYVVTSLPISGKLEIYHPHRGDWVPLTVGSVFMQKDILNNNVRFVHQKDIPSGQDTLRFNLQDTEGNVMMDQALSITVVEDKIPPTVAHNSGLTLKEDGTSAITAEFLSATDAEMDSMELQYMLISGPDHGHLELTVAPGKPVMAWTQGALELGILIYKHQAMDESTSDQFTFMVSDGYNNVTDVFFINIIPVDDELPFLVLNSIKAQEGIRKILSQFELEALDVDTKDRLIVFKVVKPPRHGHLQLRRDEEYIEAEVFSMLDIYKGDVSYLHDGSDTSKDSFKILLSDSKNTMYRQGMGEEPTNKPSTVHIEISSVDNGTPIIKANRGLNYLLEEEGRAYNTISSHELYTEDEDTSPENLIYSVIQLPHHGVIKLTTNQRPVSTFTQADISGGRLQYELTTYAQNISNDHFTFDVSDSRPNIVAGNIFHIQWSWFVMSVKEMDVEEQDGMVKVSIERFGNLKHPSSVTCVSRGGTAEGSSPGRQTKDFVAVTDAITFEEGVNKNYCSVPLNDDEEYEGSEIFSVKLNEPMYSLLGKPKKTVIRIHDSEDKPKVLFEASQFEVDEHEGVIYARLKRTGDINQAVSLVCVTEDGLAKGSESENDLDVYDFVHRINEKSSVVVFPPGVSVSTCSVKLNDDLRFELSENFFLVLKEPSEGAELGEINKASIVIRGPNDQSSISVAKLMYDVLETESQVKVTLERSGLDLDHHSVVWCATKSYDIEEAQPSLDYIPSSEQIHFAPGDVTALCTVNLLDDKINPRLEGPERFKIFISTPQNASLSATHTETTVTIADDEDVPSLHFTLPEIKVRENQTSVRIPVHRSGDLSKVSTVYCFTRQRSAKAGIDFMERPNSKDSIITFPKGVSKVECEVGILDDLIYEKEEEFIVKLSHPESPSDVQPYIGENKIVQVIILDWEDRPRVSFQDVSYNFAEPQLEDVISTVRIPLIRLGDVSKISLVTVSTRDGSATSGIDFQPLLTNVEFTAGASLVEIEMTIMHNSNRQWHKTFSLILGPQEPVNAELGAIVATSVTILDHESSGTSVLPAPPLVISLLHYDNIKEHIREPAIPGYPLVCVTPCDVKYPNSDATLQMCDEAGLNSSLIQYSWEVAVPAEGDTVLTPFHSLTDDTLFASPHKKVLDSMFFARHFRVRCIAQPVRPTGVFGIPLRSKPIAISNENGICQTPLVPGQPGGFQSQSFLAKLSYVNSSDENHPNTVQIYIEIPHQDGMIPLVSTFPIHNLRYLLTEKLYRAHHICSNVESKGGFLDDVAKIFPPNPRPHQRDSNLRENKTLDLYQHLDLKSCLWTFAAWYSMSQLVDECGGQVISDFQVGSGGQSFLTVRVPLYISYVYATSPPGWASLDHRTELSVSLYYNTLLWHQGLHTQPTLSAKIQVTRITIDDSGRLVIDLKTVAKFRGQFVLHHSKLEGMHSLLKSPEDLDLNFSLDLLWTAATWDGPEQVWRATSEYNLKDYTGEYSLELIPCTVSPTQAYKKDEEPACSPHPPKAFSLPVAIQQSQRPVPLIYTLNTDFHLLNSRDDFLMDPGMIDNLQEVDYKGSFGPGQTIYGRVLWHPSQDLHSAYQLYIQRVFMCTGVEGYVPAYDPTGELYKEGPQYGCIQPSSKLRHRYLILDREQPYIESNMSSPHVEAYFATDLPEFQVIRQFSGVDGFLLKTDALYKINSGHQWYLQVLYTIGPSNRRSKRDTSLSAISSLPSHTNTKEKGAGGDILHSNNSSLGMEDLPSPEFLRSLHTRNGTNMRSFILSAGDSSNSDSSVFFNVLYVVLALVILLIIIITGLLLVKRHYRKSGKEKVIVVRSLKNEREEFRRRGIGRNRERPKTVPSNMTLNSESNLKTVKVKTLAITVRNNLEDEGTEV